MEAGEEVELPVARVVSLELKLAQEVVAVLVVVEDVEDLQWEAEVEVDLVEEEVVVDIKSINIKDIHLLLCLKFVLCESITCYVLFEINLVLCIHYSITMCVCVLHVSRHNRIPDLVTVVSSLQHYTDCALTVCVSSAHSALLLLCQTKHSVGSEAQSDYSLITDH